MNEQKTPNKKEGGTAVHKTLTIVGIVLCVLLIPILIINCTLIVQSFVNKDEVPGIAGFMPFIVATDSMEPVIMTGDIIISKDISDAEKANLKVDDIITFYDPEGSGTSVLTHRIKEVKVEDGVTYYVTAGDNNLRLLKGDSTNKRGYDPKPVASDKIIGTYTNIRVPFVGNIAMFMQTTGGLITCIVVPLVLLVAYELIRRRLGDKKKTQDVDALMAELEALKAQQAGGAATAEVPATEADTTADSDKAE